MVRRFVQAIRRRKLRTIAIALILGFIALNALAFMHARAMTHFTSGHARTAAPEALGFFAKVSVLLTGIDVPRPLNTETPDDIGLPFTAHHFTSDDGFDLEAWHIPSTRETTTLILCFPGYAASKSTLLPYAKALNEMGYATLLVDFRACGGSSGTDTTIGYREALDVAAAVRFARANLAPKRIVLLGGSMGATAVMRAVALDATLADAIIVEAPFDRLLSTAENRFTSMHLPSFPFARLLVFWGGVRQGYWAFHHNPVDYARDIPCPVLHMHGDRDPRVTMAQAQSIFNNFAGPKQFVVFNNVGHESYIAAQPREWRDAVEAFLPR